MDFYFLYKGFYGVFTLSVNAVDSLCFNFFGFNVSYEGFNIIPFLFKLPYFLSEFIEMLLFESEFFDLSNYK